MSPLTEIWNVEIVQNRKFSTKLKLADITPLHKKLETIFKENYRPVSLLPVVSKIFERLMSKQMKEYIEKHLSPYLCGYRSGFNSQYAFVAMVEKNAKNKRDLVQKIRFSENTPPPTIRNTRVPISILRGQRGPGLKNIFLFFKVC